MKRLIKESGIRDINKIAKRYKKAKIYFHQDLDGVTSVYGSGTYGTSVYFLDAQGPGWTGELAQVQDYLPTGIRNQRYAGCKLTSPGFNINSTQTIDGKPVVEFRSANPNQLIYQNVDNVNGSFVLA